jgi:hypothetical protein
MCGTVGTLEGEHVFAQWLRNMLGLARKLRRHRIIHGPGFTVQRKWTKLMSTRRAWCVCYDCNHGWMKKLEDAVKPTLSVLARLGTKIALPAGDDTRRLVVWALKTAAVAQELPPTTLKPIGAATRQRLQELQEPPPGALAWMLPSTEPDMDAVCMIAQVGVGNKAFGYMVQVVVGRVRIAVLVPYNGGEMPLQPSGVLGVPAIAIWPKGLRIIN